MQVYMKRESGLGNGVVEWDAGLYVWHGAMERGVDGQRVPRNGRCFRQRRDSPPRGLAGCTKWPSSCIVDRQHARHTAAPARRLSVFGIIPLSVVLTTCAGLPARPSQRMYRPSALLELWLAADSMLSPRNTARRASVVLNCRATAAAPASPRPEK